MYKLEILTAKNRTGSTHYIKAGLVKGRKILEMNGYKPCLNPNYFGKNGMFCHYNKFSKVWYYEG